MIRSRRASGREYELAGLLVSPTSPGRDRPGSSRVIQLWVSLPWAGPGAYYGSAAADDGTEARGARSVGCRPGRSPLSPRPTARRSSRADGGRLPHGAHDRRRALERLGVATLVANVGLGHPLPLLRRFANLAMIHGATRVYAGLGAGWSRSEFEALGMPMPSHRRATWSVWPRHAHSPAPSSTRAGRARSGAHIRTVDAPLAPAPDEAPRILLLGGGSADILDLAGRYADHIDLAPPPRRGANQFQRPLLTTTEELAASAHASRAPDPVT